MPLALSSGKPIPFSPASIPTPPAGAPEKVGFTRSERRNRGEAAAGEVMEAWRTATPVGIAGAMKPNAAAGSRARVMRETRIVL
jgi:hypothetical protein